MKTALVTGAGRGIGRAAADALAKAGLRVVGLVVSHTTSSPVGGTRMRSSDTVTS